MEIDISLLKSNKIVAIYFDEISDIPSFIEKISNQNENDSFLNRLIDEECSLLMKKEWVINFKDMKIDYSKINIVDELFKKESLNKTHSIIMYPVFNNFHLKIPTIDNNIKPPLLAGSLRECRKLIIDSTMNLRSSLIIIGEHKKDLYTGKSLVSMQVRHSSNLILRVKKNFSEIEILK